LIFLSFPLHSPTWLLEVVKALILGVPFPIDTKMKTTVLPATAIAVMLVKEEVIVSAALAVSAGVGRVTKIVVVMVEGIILRMPKRRAHRLPPPDEVRTTKAIAATTKLTLSSTLIATRVVLPEREGARTAARVEEADRTWTWKWTRAGRMSV